MGCRVPVEGSRFLRVGILDVQTIGNRFRANGEPNRLQCQRCRSCTRFRAGTLGELCPEFARSWGDALEYVMSLFTSSTLLHEPFDTANAIERLSSKGRRAVRLSTRFPEEGAASKLIYMALRDAQQ